MAQTLAQDIDFNSSAQLLNIRGIIYSGVGSPNGIVIGANIGAIYVDQAASQLWFCINAGTTANYSWIPYGSLYSSSITISSDVQEGHLVGIFGPGAWSQSGNLNVTRFVPSSSGNSTAAFIAGGFVGGTELAATEIYNGSSWNSSGNLNTSRDSAVSAGSQNAAFINGGENATFLSSTETFNGSVWTAGSNSLTSRSAGVGAGSQNAGMITSGGQTLSNLLSTTEIYNGSTWSSSGNLNVSRISAAGGGTQLSGFVTTGAGASSNVLTSTELFNGSSWILSTGVNLARQFSAGSGYQNSAILSGGLAPVAGVSSEIFNGSTWSVSGNLAVSRYDQGSAGTSGTGFVAGGAPQASASAIASENHIQSTYRVLTYRDYPAAQNIGIAVNVSQTQNNASLIRGVLPSNIVSPYFKQSSLSASVVYNNQFFGLTKFNNDVYPSIASSITSGQVSSLSVTKTGQLIINLSANNSLSNLFYPGMLLNISNTGTGIPNGNYPIVGGSYTAPIIKFQSAVVTGGEALLITPTHGKVIFNLQANAILSGSTFGPNNSAALSIQLIPPAGSSTQAAAALGPLIRVGDILQIPYGTTTATGSFFNYGSYQIQNVSYVGQSVVIVTVYQIRPLAASEFLVNGLSVYSQVVHSPVCLDDDSILLGLNSRVNVVGNPGFDDSCLGPV